MPNPQPPADDDVSDLLPKRQIPWGGLSIAIVGVLALVGVVVLYSVLGERGISVKGQGHAVFFEKGGGWVFLDDGGLLRVADESELAFRPKLGSGTLGVVCEHVAGHILDERLHLDELRCAEGKLADKVAARLRKLGLKWGYWADGLVPKGDDLEPHLRTLELYASMIDRRFDHPQLLWLWRPLYPESVRRARAEGAPPPVVVSVKRNDFQIQRLTRPELEELLARPAFVYAGAAAQGGWLVRRVELAPDVEGDVRRLLINPEEDPWPKRMADPIIRVGPGERQAASPEGGPAAGP